MHNFGLAKKERTGFMGVVTHCHHGVELNILQFIHMLRAVPANIHSRLGHDFDGIRI